MARQRHSVRCNAVTLSSITQCNHSVQSLCAHSLQLVQAKVAASRSVKNQFNGVSMIQSVLRSLKSSRMINCVINAISGADASQKL
eukprot:3680757-Amphidinium_carterae.1